ncbi:MAG TPA: hypothetical protein V6C96_02715 [Vampirovibrionales bacterium]
MNSAAAASRRSARSRMRRGARPSITEHFLKKFDAESPEAGKGWLKTPLKRLVAGGSVVALVWAVIKAIKKIITFNFLHNQEQLLEKVPGYEQLHANVQTLLEEELPVVATYVGVATASLISWWPMTGLFGLTGSLFVTGGLLFFAKQIEQMLKGHNKKILIPNLDQAMNSAGDSSLSPQGSSPPGYDDNNYPSGSDSPPSTAGLTPDSNIPGASLAPSLPPDIPGIGAGLQDPGAGGYPNLGIVPSQGSQAPLASLPPATPIVINVTGATTDNRVEPVNNSSCSAQGGGDDG